MEAQLRQNPLRGRQALRRLFAAGRIIVEPQPDGTYLAQSQLFPMMVLAENSNDDPGEDRRYLRGVAGARTPNPRGPEIPIKFTIWRHAA